MHNHTNYQSEIGNFIKKITPEVYQEKINDKSYSREGSDVRKKMGWSDISTEEAEKRLQTYNEAFNELKQFALQNGAYFEKMKQYQQAVKTGDKEAKAEAKEKLQNEFGKIVSTMKELQTMLGVDDSPAKRGELSAQLTSVAMSAAELNEVRSTAAKRRAVSQAQKTTSLSHDVAPNDLPLIVISTGSVSSASLPKGKPQHATHRVGA